MIYLDHNAGSPPAPEAASALQRVLAQGGGNPSSVHGPGRAARAELERARDSVARAIGAVAGSIVFTSGATESVHLAIRGVRPAGAIVATNVEHPAVEGALAACGREIRRLDARRLEDALDRSLEGAALATMPLGGHETGDLLPVREVADRCRARGVLVHADAAQALGRVPLDVRALGVDLLSISGHKCGGLPGSGALWVREGLDLEPVLGGGGQERGRRGGTEAFAVQAAFGAACEGLTPDAVERRAAAMGRLRDGLEREILRTVAGVAVNGLGGPRLPNTLSLSLDGIDGHELVIALDLRGFAVSSGSACASGLREPSPVLRALYPDQPWRAAGALRVSLGPSTRPEEVHDFARALRDSADLLRRT